MTLFFSATQWLKSSSAPKTEQKGWRHKLTWKYIRNNLRKILFVAVFIVIQLLIAVTTILSVLEYQYSDVAYTVIKSCTKYYYWLN